MAGAESARIGNPQSGCSKAESFRRSQIRPRISIEGLGAERLRPIRTGRSNESEVAACSEAWTLPRGFSTLRTPNRKGRSTL